ncbi:MAG: hypothetical protein HQK53_16760, partial [Oligoflexia bacterium]|nr:hypothetical protein [Oligoflexia bacterium]
MSSGANLENLDKDLPAIRDYLLKTFALSDEDSNVRTVEEAGPILQTILSIQKDLYHLFSLYPHLEKIFDSDFDSFQEFCGRDNIIDICFI